MKTMHLFAGAGGGILSDLILGHEPVVAVEWDRYACQVLRERVAGGWFPGMQVWEGDVRLFDPSEYAGRISCIHAGFPCQDISNAGNQAGVGEGTRSGLYREVLRIADEVRPEYIFLENVAAIVTGDDGAMLRTVIGDLAERGFDAVWQNISAAEVGAKHKRNRWWLLGYPSSAGLSERRRPKRKTSNAETRARLESELERPSEDVADTEGRQNRRNSRIGEEQGQSILECSGDSRRETDVADTISKRQQRPGECGKRRSEATDREREAGDVKSVCERKERSAESSLGRMVNDVPYRGDWNEVEAQVGRVTDEKENRAARLKALGNAQVPLQAAVAFTYLWQMMEAANEA